MNSKIKRLEELEELANDLKSLSNAELTQACTDVKRIFDIIKTEVNERFVVLFPEIEKPQIDSTAPYVKAMILKRFGGE